MPPIGAKSPSTAGSTTATSTCSLAAEADLAGCTRPGQFYQLKCPEGGELQPFLLRPMSVYGVGPEAGTIEFLYNVTGVGTRALAALEAGDAMEIVGPLGNTFGSMRISAT